MRKKKLEDTIREMPDVLEETKTEEKTSETLFEHYFNSLKEYVNKSWMINNAGNFSKFNLSQKLEDTDKGFVYTVSFEKIK